MRRRFCVSVGLVVLIGIAVPSAVLAVAPTISRLSPSSGPLGTLVSIYGSTLGNASAVRFNGVKAPIISDTSSHIVTTVPAGANTGYITVKTSNGTATSPTRFEVTFGILLSLSTAQPKQKIYISGAGFSAGRKVALYFDRILRATVSTNGRGAFVNMPLTVPGSAQPGQHHIGAVDLASGASGWKLLSIFTNWPQFRNVAALTGVNAVENTISESNVGTLAVAWSGATSDGQIYSSPAVDAGVVYVGSTDGNLYAFPANGCGSASCQRLWMGTTGDFILSSPAVANGVVYIGSMDGKLYAFPAAGCGPLNFVCAPLWMAAIGDHIASSPTVANGVVYIGSYDGKLYAFAAKGCGSSACAPLWTSTKTGDQIVSSPAVANGVLYLNSDKLYAFPAAGCGASTCLPTWTATFAGAVGSSPAVSNGVVYVTANDVLATNKWDRLFAFNANGCGSATCAPLWTSTRANGPMASPAVDHGVVYVGSGDGNLYAFAAKGCASPPCAPLWSVAADDLYQSSPAVANGVVYVGSHNARLYAFAGGGYDCGLPPCAPLWSSLPTGGAINSSPAVANGVVYVGSNDGKLYAFTLNGN